MRFYQFWCIILFFLAACSGRNSEKEVKQGKIACTAYSLNEPSEVFELPDELEEISGLAAVSDTHLICNEDETGTLYIFNIRQGKVEREFKWGKKGDYEGTALADGDVWVLKSNGKVYRIGNYQSPDPKVTEIKTGLDSDCDAEGLAALPSGKSLLIACKEGEADTRIIYEYKLEEGSLAGEPYLQMQLADIENHLINTGFDKFSVGLKKMLDPKGSSGVMFPSGIAVHPQTNDLYILSSKSKLLVIYSDGVLKEAIELTNKLFRQPEAIAFTPNGDLYIGNEGKGGKGNILKFVYDQQ